MSEMVTPPPAEPVPSAPVSMNQPVASYLHTALMVALMAGVALLSAAGHKGRPQGPMSSYIATIVWQWALFALVMFGVRRKGLRLADLMGERWRRLDDVLMDFVYAGGFFIGSKIILAVIIVAAMKLLQLPDDTFSLAKSMEAVGPLTPRNPLEIATWMVLSVTAGFVEEVVFRGYLQRQFTALTRNAATGIVLSALLFGGAHAYQGGLQMSIITALGAMFGVLAYWRKSLKPGIIAHAGQDIISGIALSFLSKRLPLAP